MSGSATAPYGAFKSPITTDLIVAKTLGLREPSQDNGDVYWLELRPSEGGRYVVVRRTAVGQVADITPAGFNARTTVHEYGGGSYFVHQGNIFFSNFADQRIYHHVAGDEPRPLTPAQDIRYADGVFDAGRGRIIAVREDHRDPSREAVNTIVSLDPAAEDEGDILAEGNDFYSDPRLSHDGAALAWLAWDHPNMPWDGTELWIATLDGAGKVTGARLVAGSPGESIFQPEWSPDGTLFFVSDRSGWWNLYSWKDGETRLLWEKDAEFGLPQWVFRSRTYAVLADGRLLCSYEKGGSWLGILDPRTGSREEIDTPFSVIAGVQASGNKAVFLGGSATQAHAVIELDLDTGGFETLRRSSEVAIDPGYISIPEAIDYPTEDGLTAHAFYYAPKNKDYAGPDSERPPLLVISHGGPTSAVSGQLSLPIQFWTSRGIGVVDVNYGGSTSYGREYRERLKGRWGIVDIDDCVNAALYLVERGEADPRRLAIRGGSAGGYTTLASLAFRDVFAAGASYYGVSDLEALVKDTHKFESRYLEGLIGPYPQRRDLYLERSPIHHLEGFDAPMIVLQGLEDKVVPPNQAEMIVDALRQKGVPVAYLTFEGEQHGFRRAENIKKSLGAELYFYSRVFGFEPPDTAEPITIENL